MSERNESGGMGMTLLCGLLIVTQIVLIVLKLTKVIDGWLYICIPSIILGGSVVTTILFAIIIKIIDYFLQRIK